MSIADRRRAGVNLLSCLKAAKKIMSNSEFEAANTRELAQAILEEIQSKKLPQLRDAEPGVDWDAIIAFIEKLLPLILQLLAIFGI